jgi:hypothetical protein
MKILMPMIEIKDNVYVLNISFQIIVKFKFKVRI